MNEHTEPRHVSMHLTGKVKSYEGTRLTLTVKGKDWTINYTPMDRQPAPTVGAWINLLAAPPGGRYTPEPHSTEPLEGLFHSPARPPRSEGPQPYTDGKRKYRK